MKAKPTNRPRRRKLHERDIIRVSREYPGKEIFRCTKINAHQMAFWCPRCFETHRHGLDPEPFTLGGRVAHCGGERWVGPGQFQKKLGYDWYFVFWDGTELPERI
jgi:hypothetical protein